MDSKTVYSQILDEFSIKKQYQKIKPKIFHILIGGMLDTITTILALSVFSLTELNPLINQLIPDYTFLIPVVLVELAFLRFILISSIFKKSKYLNFAVLFTLYSLPIWNTCNIIISQM